MGDWCPSATDGEKYLSGASAVSVDAAAIGNPPYASDKPKVFNVTYSDPKFNLTDADGYLLKLSEAVYDRGYNKQVIEGQLGGFLAHSDNNARVMSYNVLVNTTVLHSSSMFKSLMDQLVYRMFAKQATPSIETSKPYLKVNSHPIPETATTTAVMSRSLSIIAIAMGFYPASMVVFLVKERHPDHNLKAPATRVWRWLGYMALSLIQAYDLSALAGSKQCTQCTNETFPAVIALFVLFGVAIVPKWFYRSSPIYCLANRLLDITNMATVNSGGDGVKNGRSTSPFALENAGYEILFLAVDAALFFAVAVGIDYALTFPKVKAMVTKDPLLPIKTEVEDEDVAAEAERVSSGRADSDMIKLHGIRKVYRRGHKVAVKNLSLGLKRGECFGFLGINGAGKTTTMKMLTGDIVPTAGRATLSGFDILTQQIDVRREIGSCPRFDALIDLLSVREHLELFAQIKGIKHQDLEAVVMEQMAQLNLLDFEHKLAGSLSGGNKRKLSVAIAMIGSPSILFLDEPSTGMDPASRRFMWDVISEISTYNKESTVVLTTHSMEECEALCTRVGIMVGGGLKCLGSVQHLKNRFGDGLMVDAKLLPLTTTDVTELTNRHFDSQSQVTREQIADTCARLGMASREDKLIASSNASL